MMQHVQPAALASLDDLPPWYAELTDATFEGGALASLLPHLDSESTFNQRTSQSLHRRRLPPEAYYEGTSGV